MQAHALMLLHHRVNELAHIAKKIQTGVLLTKASLTHSQRIMDKIGNAKGLSQTVRRINPRWAANIDFVLGHTPLRDAGVLKGIAAVALHDATEWKLHTTEKAAKSWTEYVARHLKNGAGSAHRLIEPFDFTTLRSGPNVTAKAADILHADWQQWKAVWTRLGSVPTAPWRQATVSMDVPPIAVEDVTRAVGSFKTNTSIGVDRFPPKILQWISRPLM